MKVWILFARITVVAAVYVLLAKGSLYFGSMAGQVTPIWLPSGFTLAALLLGGPWLVSGVAIGSLALQLELGMPLWAASLVSLGEVVEPLVSWYVLRRAFQFRNSMGRIQDVFGLLLSSVLLGTTVNATLGTVTLCAAGYENWDRFGSIWQTWWIANSTGSLTVAPFLLVWSNRHLRRQKGRAGEIFLLSIVCLGFLAFTFSGSQLVPDLKLEYAIFPTMIWAALRFGQRGAVSVTLVTVAFAVWGTVNRYGPFASRSISTDLILLQTFLSTLALTGLVLAAITEERARANAELTYANAELERRVFSRTAELSKANAFLNALLDSVGAGIAACDEQGRLTVANRQIRELHLPGADLSSLEAYKDVHRLYELDGITRLEGDKLPLLRALHGEVLRDVEHILRRDETSPPRVLLMNAQPILDESKVLIGAVVAAHDITVRKSAEEQLRHGARHDALTELPNRAEFLEILERVMGHAKRRPGYIYSVLFLDLDRFKVVNDSLGHLAGDQLLIAVAKRLQSCLRNGDTVARLGGDEFTVLLDDVRETSDGSETSKIAKRIQQALSRPFRLELGEIYTGCSIGIAVSNPGYERAEEILRDADTALYRAKRLGRGRYEMFDEAMHTRAVARLQLETDLRRAFDREEFCLHYQPIVRLSNGGLAGYEALVRWNHPTRGLVSPADFIPVAEETGLIGPLGMWVLEEACTWLKPLSGIRKDLYVSVNVSPRQLARGEEIVHHAASVLTRTGLEPECLKLEITESALMEDIAGSARALTELRSIGIGIQIDDFGTGYSSLAYLSRLPISALKIDRSFVRSMEAGHEDLEIIRAVVALAGALNLETIAEGIETSKQRELLESLGCTLGQGYLFSKPLDAAAAGVLLGKGSLLSCESASRTPV